MQSKYYNKKTTYKGTIYDSKKEAIRAKELDILQRAGLICNLERQRPFELQPSFRVCGTAIRPITYVADFYYYDKTKQSWVVEDTKGFRTEVYKLKKKMFLYKYSNEILFIES